MKLGLIKYTALLTIILSCSIEEEFPLNKPYPSVTTLSPIENNESGVTLRAEFTYNDPDKIIQLGFVLIRQHDTTIFQVDYKDLNYFTLRLDYDLNVGEEYDYYAFVITDKYKVYGALETFICQGVSKQIIKDFYPKEGPDNTVITIVGDYFRSNPLEVSVKLNDKDCPILYTSKDTLKVRVPPSSYYGITTLSVEINNTKVNASNNFIIHGPTISSISNYVGYPGSEIEIFGNHFKANDEDLLINVGSYKADVIESTDTYIKVVLPVPGENVMKDHNWLLSIKNGLKVAHHNKPLMTKKTWKLIGSIPFLNDGFRYNTVTYDNKAYIIRYQFSKMMQIEPELNNWTEVTTYPGERDTPHPLHVVNNNMYKFEGSICCSSVKEDEVLKYDFSSGIWEVLKPTPIDYDWSMTSFVFDNNIYFLKGSGEFWKYDPVKDEYNFIGITALSGIRVFSFVLKDAVYAVTPGKTWRYNPLEENWIEVAKNEFTKTSIWQLYHMDSFVKDNTAYLMYDKKIYLFKPDIGKWKHVSNWPECVYLGPTFNVDNKLYMLNIITSYNCPDQNMYEFIHTLD